MDALDSQKRAAYRPDIDGMRALAVTPVCLFHAGLPFVSGGFVGVDVFFVISGYLIGGIIYSDIVEAKFSFATFYARRARRILPALFVVLALSSVLGLLLLTPLELLQFAKYSITTIFAVSNIAFFLVTNYFSPSAVLNPLLMTWTLGIEEQFYFIVPALLLLLFRVAQRRIFAAIAFLTVISFLVCLWATFRFPSASFYLLPSRAWELAAGTLLAIFQNDYAGEEHLQRLKIANISALIGAILIAFSIFGLDSNTPFPGLAALCPVAGAVLLLAARNSFINRSILSLPPFVFVGRISYSWYLLHWPLLSFARIANNGQLTIRQASIIVAISFVLAIFSWKFVEQPFRSIRAPISLTLRGYAIATLAIVTLSIGLTIDHGLSQRFPASLQVLEKDYLGLPQDACLVSYGASKPNLSASCFDPNARRGTVALLGDSHAAALGAALRLKASQKGYGFLQFTKASCPPLLGLTRRMPNHPSHERECAVFTSRALSMVMSSPDVKIVVIAGYWSAPFIEEASGSRFVRINQTNVAVSPKESIENLAFGLSQTIEGLRASNKRVILALDVPMYRFDPLRRIEAQYIPARMYAQHFLAHNAKLDNWSAPQAQLVNASDAYAQIPRTVASRFSDVTILDPVKAFCTDGQCRYANSSSVYYIDSQHLSLAGAEVALRSLKL